MEIRIRWCKLKGFVWRSESDRDVKKKKTPTRKTTILNYTQSNSVTESIKNGTSAIQKDINLNFSKVI